ncbi:hypothetical protein ACP4OV_012320 [Aristida adscensionis]
MTKQFLLHIVSGTDVEKDVRIHKRKIRAVGQMKIRSDLMDAHLYAVKRTILQEVLEHKEAHHSVRLQVLPYLRSVPPGGNGTLDETGNSVVPSIVQAYSDINRDVVGDANHLSGYAFSAQNNVIHPSSVLGSKTTIGPHCMLAEGSQLGDKAICDWSSLQNRFKCEAIVNSVVMNHVVIDDGCHIQGSVVCNISSTSRTGFERLPVVGAGYVVTTGSEHKAESLAKK